MMDDFFLLRFYRGTIVLDGTLLLLPHGCHVCERDLKCNFDVFDLRSTD